MIAAKRVGLIVAIFLAAPFFMLCESLAEPLVRVWLQPFPVLVAAAPHLPESLGCLVWLAVECLPLLVWPSWRDVGSLRLRWSWTVLVPLFISAVNLSSFIGLPAGHPWAGILDVLGQTLLIAVTEELLCRGYMFHDRPRLHPQVTVFASSVAFALLHYNNLNHDNWQEVNRQVALTFFMGLGLGTVRLATGNLGWCILIHWWINATDGLASHGSELTFLTNVVAVPVWMLLTVLLFCVHPALRPFPAAVSPPPPAADPTRGRFLRRAVVGLLGTVASLALFLASVFLLVPRPDPAPTRVAAAWLVGCIGLPGALLALSVARWRRWQRSSPAPTDTREDLALVPVASPPEWPAVKLGATFLCFVSLLATLSMAFCITLPGFASDLALLREPWQMVWENGLRLGTLGLLQLSAPCLAGFSLRLALRPRCSWRTALGWIYGVAFYGVFIWFTRTRLHIHFDIALALRIDVWYIAVAGLVTALFLAMRDFFQLRWRDWASQREV